METLQTANTKGTNTLMQSLEYLPTRYLPELGGEGEQSFQYSKQNGHAMGE